LEITGPAVEIEAAYTRIDQARTALDTFTDPQDQAGGVTPDPDTLPTLGQRRLAAFLHLLGLTNPPAGTGEQDSPASGTSAAGAAGACGVKVNVHVVVDLPTILHLANHPAELLGYGPIDPTLARALAAEGEWNRWVIDPVTGHLLDEGRTRFAGPHLRAYLKARDGTCCTPGCASPAQDADHLPGWAQGTPTAAASMAAMCAYHNRNRQAAGWDATMLPDTSIAFNTPLGQTPIVPPRTPLLRNLPDVLPEDDPPPF
jgi:hypothetical protein